MTTLLIFMAADFFSGWIVAGIFKNSPKTLTGALSSKIGFKGLAKKVMILLFVLIAARLDIEIGTSYIKTAVCIAFMANDLLSLTENAGLMGLKLLQPLLKAVDLLKSKSESGE
jgi:toxin secretion/phage lysis holin